MTIHIVNLMRPKHLYEVNRTGVGIMQFPLKSRNVDHAGSLSSPAYRCVYILVCEFDEQVSKLASHGVWLLVRIYLFLVQPLYYMRNVRKGL